ncbi:hypothetical protein K450DRAFT_253062 [Umbelopsis ramanniana AG]|uniref:Uncharacterized protein n=1 Tax=Umbelopsis ramanniana AG TaxID=1314678 RepID=A0AAD5HC32_UMBRA|nr:uncharacterized protein K450DRAFT_253062 [Umbelopsis ramanniana AG]KAI8577141.1 hypothetical protein K450DRAFT_253062 [Umbelopsis ramanniana AG]
MVTTVYWRALRCCRASLSLYNLGIHRRSWRSNELSLRRTNRLVELMPHRSGRV